MTMIVDTISVLGSLSSIAGLSLKDIFQDRDASISKIRPLLARLEQSSDKFVGYWLLREWKTTSPHLSGYHVSGGMAIYHRYPETLCWEGEIVLMFDKGPKTGEIPNYKPFVARYRVSFTSDQHGVMSGTCHMLEKIYLRGKFARVFARLIKEKEGYRWRGVFFNCQIRGDGGGRLFTGRFYNTLNSKVRHRAHFVFHLPKRWGELNISELLKT